MSLHVLIVGGGLTGILLSEALNRKSVSHKVIHYNLPHAGSSASSGILNPVMGRRRQVVPYYELLLPAAIKAYQQLENLLQIPVFHAIQIVDIHLSAAERDFFEQRTNEIPQFLKPKVLVEAAGKLDAGWGATSTEGGFVLALQPLLTHYHAHLRRNNQLLDAQFYSQDVTDNSGSFEYAGETFSHIILCNGISTLEALPFQKLPLSANKGQALIIETDAHLPADALYKWSTGMSLVPLSPKRYWAGASFEWKWESNSPTDHYRNHAEALLRQCFPYPFKVSNALAGFRTSSLDRRPVVGLHPQRAGWGTVNGMGTKGILQAPYCARQMADSIATGTAVDPEFSLNRFQRVLR